MSDKSHDILNEPLENLSISAELKKTLSRNRFKNLAEVIKFNADELTDDKELDYHNIVELIDFLSSHGLRDLFHD